MICAVIAMPKSAAMSAASSSSMESAVSLGERVTMRLISWTSLLCVLASPALNLANKPMRMLTVPGDEMTRREIYFARVARISVDSARENSGLDRRVY